MDETMMTQRNKEPAIIKEEPAKGNFFNFDEPISSVEPQKLPAQNPVTS